MRMCSPPQASFRSNVYRQSTSRVGIAFLPGEEAMHRAEAGELGLAEAIVIEKLGHDSGPKELGDRTASGGSSGRGAEGWCAVAEWTLDAAGQGLIGAGAATAGAWLWRRLKQLGDQDERVLVSRGAAILIAAAYAMERSGRTETLEVEAAEDPVTMRGGIPSEAGYAGVEPWIICLVISADRVSSTLCLSVLMASRTD